MKYYKAPNNDIYAYELDGSQDHLIPDDFLAITKQEVDRLNQIKLDDFIASMPKPTKEELQAQLLIIQQQLDALK